ncbi:hypothetical protein RN001_015365 [Aquatica leii]|uniref:Membrane insertase YidC/Oxa/ALB C-terminal domain-containing protein n=1 Tax=Aquatica leii TaxID=1421715 RepID=A0AAN7P3B1_9COLE|nr:hypothetical protein RN001_015365 [Aquatica leii]
MNIILSRSRLLTSTRIHLYKYRNLATNESVIQTQPGLFRLISESTPVDYLQKFIISVHDTTGLPWWATIICTTIFLRSTVTVPLAIYQNYIIAKVRNIQLELAHLDNELKAEVQAAIKLYQWDEKTAKFHYKRSLKKQWNSLVVRDNCHPVKSSLLIWFQIPLWVCFSAVLRNLAYKLPEASPTAVTVFNELTTSGFGWISNLTQADPLFILPIMFGLINLGIIEIQVLSRTSAPTKLQKYLMNFFRGFAIIMVPITATVPSCVALYWTTSSAYGIFQNFLLMSPKLKTLCRVPKTSNDLEKPYAHLFNNVKKRYSLPKSA